MNDVMFAIDMAVVKGTLDGKQLGTDDELHAAFEAVLSAYARGTMQLSIDGGYRVATGALILEAEKRGMHDLSRRLRNTAESIKILNAAMGGVPVDFSAMPEEASPLPLIPWTREWAKKEGLNR